MTKTPAVEMRTNMVYSLSYEIHCGVGNIVEYHKTLLGEVMFTSIANAV